MRNQVRRAHQPNYRRCAFTGYRPAKMPFGYDEKSAQCRLFKRCLDNEIEALIGQGYAHFLSGGAMGMDMFAAEAVVALRARYPWILLEMVSPFDAQPARWDEEHRRRHAALFQQADIVTATGHEYTRGCMLRRNRYLVDNADLLLAAFDGQPGGTAMTVRYAEEIGVKVRYVWPAEFARSAMPENAALL